MSFTLNFQENYKNNIDEMKLFNLICPLCMDEYPNKIEFFNHLCIHSGNVLLEHMESLKKELNNDSQMELINFNENLLDNMNKTILRPFKCQQCNLTFDRASQYDYHYRSIHLGEKSQLCEICGKGFFRKADLKTHLNIHLGTNICICEICGRKFNHISNLIRHCRMHTGVKLYPCCICGKRFTQISSLARHKRIHERQRFDGKSELPNNSNSDEGEHKDKTTKKNKFVEGGVPNQQKVNKRHHYCKVCGESFNIIFLLREHEKSHSQHSECKKSKEKSLECTTNPAQNIDRFEFVESAVGKARTVLPLETIIYITSEQLKKINLENIEDNGTYVPLENLCETKLAEPEELHVSEKLPFDNEQSQLAQDTLHVLCKSDNSAEKENVTYICQVDENILKTKLYVQQPCESDFPKEETVLSYNALLNAATNVTDLFQKIDLSEPSGDKRINMNASVQQPLEAGLIRNEKLRDNLSDVNNIVTNEEEPMLRLVQAETGEQFYEFLINNLVGKVPGNQLDKTAENKNGDTSLNEDNQGQSIRDDIHSDINYAEYELEAEEKNFTTSQILLDPQTDFDKYVETNFEVFERLNYDEGSERFLEFDDATGLNDQNCKTSESDKGSEEFLQFQSFDADGVVVQGNEKNAIISGDDNGNKIQISEKNECHENGIIIGNDVTEDQQQESRKSKAFLIKFQCTVCEKSFSTSYNYKQHIGTHFADQQKFHCKDCKMSFAWKSTLNKHIANNHRPEGPQKFACDICNKMYNTSSQVNEHVKRDHLKQRNHVCVQCGKSFFKKYDLKIHNRIHTDERPYVCRACGKRFHHRSHIIRHERIHF